MDKPNRLAQESSQYLLQHAKNPVDWYPWGDEAFEVAKRLDRPVFLSIGYSACHWCHVMEIESFSQERIASVLNKHFISIKVDREERPDIDHIYMAAVQILSQKGGWPLSVFLTPDKKPFYGGTYFPPEDRHGMPSFERVLLGIATAWKERRIDVTKTSTDLSKSVRAYFNREPSATPTMSFSESLQTFVDDTMRTFDSLNGGFGSAPKFFHTEQHRLYLRHSAYRKDPKTLSAVCFTLDRISRGGIRDQLGGGFHRYSTDQGWLVPHFEKMLYDNALLAITFCETYLETREPVLAQVARHTFDFMITDLQLPHGGFASTFDADSEAVEGKFYVWSKADIERHLPAQESKLFCDYFGVTQEGNWESTNILHVPERLKEFCHQRQLDSSSIEEHLESAMRKLLTVRRTRVAPGRDDKIICAWNSMAIEALAIGFRVLDDLQYLTCAEKTARFLLDQLAGVNRMAHSISNGKVAPLGFLDDHAYLLNGLVELFLSTGNDFWLKQASTVRDQLLSHFWDEHCSQFFYASFEDSTLIVRPRDTHDGAVPAAAAVATLALARLSLCLGDAQTLEIAQRSLKSMQQDLVSHPAACGSWLMAADFCVNDPRILVFVLGKNETENDAIRDRWRELPSRNRLNILASKNDSWSIAKGKEPVEDKVTLTVCTDRECESKIVGYKAIDQKLLELFPMITKTDTRM